MRTIVLNSNNVIQDGQNNKLVYQFPNSVKFEKSYLSVASVSMYYSWFNITEVYNNNKINLGWVNNVRTPFTIPDGLYEVDTLNKLFQFFSIANNWYLVNPAGQNVYYAEFVINESQYVVQINTFYVPTSAEFTSFLQPLGWVAPAGFVFAPSTSTTPTIEIPIGLGKILGFTALTTIPSASSSGQYNRAATPVTSTTSPNLQPNSSVLISSSMIDNPYTSPTSVIYSITPSVAVGEIIADRPPNFMWNKLIDGVYNQLRITLLGNDLSPLKIQDGAITIILAIAGEDEVKTR